MSGFRFMAAPSLFQLLCGLNGGGNPLDGVGYNAPGAFGSVLSPLNTNGTPAFDSRQLKILMCMNWVNGFGGFSVRLDTTQLLGNAATPPSSLLKSVVITRSGVATEWVVGGANWNFFSGSTGLGTWNWSTTQTLASGDTITAELRI